MSGDAEVKLKFVSDEKALASMEQKLASMRNELDRVAAAGKKVGQTKIDPFAARMSGGSVGDSGIASMMSRQAVQQQKNLAMLDREIDRYKKLSDAKANAFGIAMPSAGNLVGSMVAAMGAGAVAVGQRSTRWSEDVSKSSFNMGELELKLMNQADISKQEAQNRIRTVGAVLKKTPSIGTLTGGVEMQTWLESAGLNKQDVQSGKMLDTIAEGLTTLNAFGKDKGFTSDKESVRTIVGGAKAFGLGDTAEAVKEFSDTISMGFKVSAMEAQHLPTFLREGAAMSALGVTPQESMGVFSTMVSSGMPAESAAVAMRTYGTKLADVKPGQERDQALASLGLKQSDVALTHDNTIFQSLAKMRGALAGKSELEQESAITQIFGGEQYAGIQMLLRDQGAMKSKAAEIGDTSALDQTVSQSRRHVSFSRTRSQIDKELSDWESSVKIGTTWEDIKLWQEKRYAGKMANANTAGERFGAGIEDVGMSVGNWFAQMAGYSPEEMAIGQQAAQESRKRQEELLERNAIAAEKTAENLMNRERNRNGNVENVQNN